MILSKRVLLVCVLVFTNSQANDASQNLTLTADQSGHFTGNVLINHYSMPFMIDTGATVTTIPMNLAVAARLPLGKQIEFVTAGGRGFGKSTTISSLNIGNVEIKNLEAHVNPNLPFVLIGMNTLKYLNMRQSGNQMTLSLHPKYQNMAQLDNGVSVTVTDDANKAKSALVSDKPSKPIKKSEVCDAHQHCVMKFGN